MISLVAQQARLKAFNQWAEETSRSIETERQQVADAQKHLLVQIAQLNALNKSLEQNLNQRKELILNAPLDTLRLRPGETLTERKGMELLHSKIRREVWFGNFGLWNSGRYL